MLMARAGRPLYKSADKRKQTVRELMEGLFDSSPATSSCFRGNQAIMRAHLVCTGSLLRFQPGPELLWDPGPSSSDTGSQETQLRPQDASSLAGDGSCWLSSMSAVRSTRLAAFAETKLHIELPEAGGNPAVGAEEARAPHSTCLVWADWHSL